MTHQTHDKLPWLRFRMLAVPLASLAAVACSGIAAAVWLVPLSARAALVAYVAAGLGFAASSCWLGLRVRQAATLRRRDEDAALTLELLRQDALGPGHVLLEIHDVQWTAHSGQRVWAVDALTGGVSDRWIPGRACMPGTLVLMRHASGRPSEVVTRMTPRALEAANRHQRRLLGRRATPGDMVVEAAERLLE